jgi:hypothetical protein
MNVPVQSKSLHGEEKGSTGGGSEKAPQYTDYDKVIRSEFGIINDIDLLFSQSSEKISQDSEEFDQPDDQVAKTVQPNVHRHLSCASTKKIKKLA